MKRSMYCITVLASMLVASCGAQQRAVRDQGKKAIKVALEAADGLALVDQAEAFSVDVVCAAGRVERKGDDRFELSSGATGCVARLLSLTYGGNTFTADPAHSFHNFMVNDEAVFVSTAANAPKLFLRVTAQLPETITADASASYAFAEHAKFNDLTAEKEAGMNVITGVSGAAAPALQVETATFAGQTMTVTLRCRSALETNAGVTRCEGLDIAMLGVAIGSEAAIEPTPVGLKAAIDQQATLLGDVATVDVAAGTIKAELSFAGTGPFRLVIANESRDAFLEGRISLAEQDEPVGERLHVIGVYQSNSDHSYGYHPGGTASVTVETGGDVVLALASYEPTTWQIAVKPGTRVTKVIVSGYHKQTVTGVTAPIIDSCYEGCSSSGYNYFYSYPSAEANAFLAKVKALTGLEPSSVQAMYDGRVFTVTNAQ